MKQVGWFRYPGLSVVFAAPPRNCTPGNPGGRLRNEGFCDGLLGVGFYRILRKNFCSRTRFKNNIHLLIRLHKF